MKKVLIVVDMQNDFINGSLGTKEAIKILPNVINKIKEYEKQNNLIIFTKDTHYENYLNTQEGINLPIKHCIKGTNGWELNEELKVFEGDIYEKSTFGSMDLAEILNKKLNSQDIQIELIGLCTDICIISNAIILKNAIPEAKIIVDASCCAGVNPKSHINALESMKIMQIKIINEVK